MSPLTDPASTEACPASRQIEPQCYEQKCDTTPVVKATGPYLARWLRTIADDESLPPDALDIANVMARSAGVGRVAFTDWQRINTALGRSRRDLAVFETMSELELEGYIDRNIDERFGRNYGWLLLIPEVEL